MDELQKSNKKGQILFIIERTLEYFISIMVGGAYLAKITQAIGISQGLTGILTSFISLGAVFQILALFLAGKSKPKRFVTLLHTINQFAFAIIYLIPLINFPKTVKTVFFCVFLLVGHIFNNLVSSPKTAWELRFVPEDKKGGYTAKKEIISLMTGIVFSFGVSFVIDYFEESGRLEIAFAISAAAIFIMALSHLLTLLKTQEREIPVASEKISFVKAFRIVFSNPAVRKVLLVATFYWIIHNAVIGFFGTYTISTQEEYGLGFSMTFISLLSMLYAVVRSLVSYPIGKFADKFSFKNACILCYLIYALSLVFGGFTTPENGKIFYTIYYLLFAISMAGVNGSLVNLLYEEVEPSQRMCAYAVQQSVTGIIGFLSAIVAGVFVDFVHSKGGTLLGLYAQQWLSWFGVAMAVATATFIWLFMKKKKK